ncbi:hypothetical protein FRC12_013778 [Ceratobasidium sp. 428]|nr:hypothetical protein FRC12_013778 [Ceratobasidium sp. 428]
MTRSSKRHSGKVYNLGDDPGLLGQLIAGAALQEVDSNKLVAQHRDTIRVQAEAKNFNVAEFSRKLHSELSAANVQHNTLAVDSMVESNPAGDKIAQIWANSDTLEEAHAKIQKLQQVIILQNHVLVLLIGLLAKAPSRIKEEYLDGALPTASLQKKPISLAQVTFLSFL